MTTLTIIAAKKSRKLSVRFFNFLIIAFFAIFFVPKFSSAQVVINEIFSDPEGIDTGKEWIELYNSGSQAVQLDGWQINGSGKYFTFPPLSFAPSSHLLVRWRADGQNTASEIFTGTQTIDANLGNTSGFAALFNSTEHNKDTIIDYLEYGKAGQTLEATAASALIWQKGQFLPAPPESQSLGLKQDGQDTNLADDWQIFSSPTPGQINGTVVNTAEQETSQQQNETTTTIPPEDIASSLPPVYSNFSDEVLINEFMPWPSSGNEWVELLNFGEQIIDLSLWQIDDGTQGSSPQKISDGTLINPGQFLKIELQKNILNNEGDQVRLIWPDNQLLHSVSFINAKPGISSSRFESGSWFWTNQPTPGQENKKSEQKTPEQPPTENSTLPAPAIKAISEAVSQEKDLPGSKNTSDYTAPANSVKENYPPQTQAAVSYVPAIPQIAEKSSDFSPLLALAAIAGLSCLSGVGIVYFRRKKLTDSRQKP